jgi:hypothetical protein
MTQDGEIHGLWLAFANEDDDIDYALDESMSTNSSLLNVLVHASKTFQDNLYWTHACNDLLTSSTWIPCKKRKHAPCFNKNKTCFYCKKKIIFNTLKIPSLFSLLHRQCLYFLCGSQLNTGEIASLKFHKNLS